MSNPISYCDECYPTSYPECEDIIFVVGLTASTAYEAIIENAFGEKYYQTVTTDTGGAFTLDIVPFGEGFFSPHSGNYVLTVKNALGVLQTMTILYSTYDCVSFDIYTWTDAN